MEPMIIKTDCRYFIGSIPCKYNKKCGVHCVQGSGIVCSYYDKIEINILLIKLGAAGDVIRTTPLLRALRGKYKNAHITWLTHFREFVPTLKDHEYGADVVFEWNEKNLIILENGNYEVIINLDKEDYSCALLKKMDAKEKYGYTLINNKPYPINNLAEHKFYTGIFDDISKDNNKSYLTEIFEICGLEFHGEEYILPSFEKTNCFNIKSNKNIIGLNTGCGIRWTSRLLPEKFWIDLIKQLQETNYEPIILGGPEEHIKNRMLENATGAKYFGVLPLYEFMELVDTCDIIITSVTMCMHIAIGLKKKIVLINNIFNKNEFELFNRGVILEPEKECKCYFSPKCTNPDYKCMETISPDKVFLKISELI